MVAAATLAVVLLVWAATLKDLATVWATSRYGAHGFCVAMFAAYTAWDARSRLPRPAWRLEPIGGLILAVATALLVLGHVAHSLPLRALSLPLAALAIALFVFGFHGARALALSLGLPLLAIPLPAPLVSGLSGLTQTLAAVAAEVTLRVLHIPVARDGLTLSVGLVDLEVAEACNGLRFLLACAVVGVGAAWGLRLGPRQGVMLVALALVAGIVANPVRVTGTAILAWVEPSAVVGTPHLIFGKLVYLAVGSVVAAVAAWLIPVAAWPPAWRTGPRRHDA